MSWPISHSTCSFCTGNSARSIIAEANSRKALASELPPITDMVWPRGNAPRLPSAAKSLSGFGKKIADGAAIFLARS